MHIHTHNYQCPISWSVSFCTHCVFISSVVCWMLIYRRVFSFSSHVLNNKTLITSDSFFSSLFFEGGEGVCISVLLLFQFLFSFFFLPLIASYIHYYNVFYFQRTSLSLSAQIIFASHQISLCPSVKDTTFLFGDCALYALNL